jgi:hypothetical protein
MTKYSSRNSAHRKWKDKQYQTTEERTRNQRITLIQLYTIKPLNNKSN